jgi:hypothetical protein
MWREPLSLRRHMKKLYKVWMELEDLVMADSREEAREEFMTNNAIDSSCKPGVRCEEFDKIMESVKQTRKTRDKSASSSVCEEILAQDMRHVGWTEEDDNGETN